MNILLIDNDKYTTEVVRQILSADYEIDIYNSSTKAFLHYSENPTNFGIVFTDFLMDKMNGDELIEEMLKINSNQSFIISTNTMNKKLIDLSKIHPDKIYLFDKPYDLKMLKVLCDSIIRAL
ncbi:MAG: hypothetical protein COA79_21465 [Planctomycetota bacterium]|nr:MAG: hypothetical protein COA79_21465 [Planctomycetota bacterium]